MPQLPGLPPVVRARLVAWGVLTLVVAAILWIVTSTLGSPAKAAKSRPVAASAVSRCCWVVKPGQTLYSIAAREGVGPAALRRANPKLVPERLIAGQRVRIPV
jgi:Tfp pilus assembly protein FimV